jgi:hypothetical protein
MDKPTEPNPADPGPCEITLTEEFILELNRKSQRISAEYEAMMRRLKDAHLTDESRTQEKDRAKEVWDAIRSARLYAKGCLHKAGTPEKRLKITRRIWDTIIPKQVREYLGFEALHAATWIEGYPSLEELAEALAKTTEASLKASPTVAQAKTRRGYRQEITAWMKSEGIKTQSEAAKRLAVSLDILKTIMSDQGKLRCSEETLNSVLKKTGTESIGA